ncbi:hypothetical protein EON83_13535 [bacterium]|nr:MAG: hypothetical protein EON83_13535 [bacterium]
MSQTLNLFDQPQNETPWIPPVSTPVLIPFTLPTLDHPYARYGLAVALWKNNWPDSGGDEAQLRMALINAIESGLAQFRMKTPDDPQGPVRLLKFHAINIADLRKDLNQVQSPGLAEKGIYLFPTVLTTDGGAKATWQEAESAVARLHAGESLSATDKLKRSFAPTTAKINNGTSSQTEPKGTLLEIACCCITTLTPHKPAAWPGQDRGNTILIPDLNVEQLRDFVELFEQMRRSKLDGDLWEAKLKPLEVQSVATSTGKKPVRAAKPAASQKAGYRRPRLHNGNFPFAPQNSEVFGAVGLLAAIGRWALEAEGVDKTWAREVLSQVAEAPLYVTSYSGISQVRFGHHIVSLAMEGRLSHILAAFYDKARLYADDEGQFINRLPPLGSTKTDYSRDYYRFYLQTSRFLQQFSRPAFADFLSSRAEYPALCRPLLDGFFAHIMIPKPIVESARLLGQHLNRTAYFVAREEYSSEKGGDDDKIRKAKAKILVEFESAILSAKSSTDMLHRISTRAGRLLNGDLPAGADIFMDAAASGDLLSLPEAQHLLIAYLRLRSPQQEKVQKEPTSEITNPTSTTNESAEFLMDDSQ